MRRELITIDCETDPFLSGRFPVPFLWDAYDGQKHYTCAGVDELLRYLSGRRAIVYAHNGGRFDYLMPGFLDGIAYKRPIKIISGRLACFTIGTCEFRDSMCIFPESLKSFCKLEIDYQKLELNQRAQHMPEIIRYLHQDTKSLYDLVAYFHATYGRGLTIAGAALAWWRDHCDVTPPRSDETFFTACKPHYHGGRVQCFHKGVYNEPFRAYDINSAYPAAMLSDHPISTRYNEIAGPSLHDTITPQSLYRIRGRSNGCLPFRVGGKTEYPSDNNTREFECTGWEIQAGIETGTLDISRVIYRRDFAETINFRAYVDHFYTLKNKAAKDPERGRQSLDYLFAKRMMNSLSGKLGAHPSEYKTYTLMESCYEHAHLSCIMCHTIRGAGIKGCPVCRGRGGNGRTAHGRLGKYTIIGEPVPEGEQRRFYSVATIASITGYTRAVLWRAICAVRARGGIPLYCDTDCLCVGGAGAFDGTVSDRLGDWSLEGEFIRGGFAGRKTYAWQYSADTINGDKRGLWKIACKGARLTPAEIMRVAGGAIVRYEPLAPTYAVGKTPVFRGRNIRTTA